RFNRQFADLNSYLHMHHRLEETMMFPKMHQKFGVEIDLLNDHHEEMRQREEKVKDLAGKLKGPEVSDSQAKELSEQLEGFVNLLLLDLNEEESRVVPFLLGTTFEDL